MFGVMAFALIGTGLANPSAKLERFAKDFIVATGSSDRQLSARLTDIAAVEARSDALAHVDALACTGVCTAEAHPRAIHQVVSRITERLIDMAAHGRVKGNHFSNGHGVLPQTGKRDVASDVPLEELQFAA